MRKTEILKIKGDWQEVVDDCRTTVGKEALGREPSSGFKQKILIAEHSPIRDLSVRFRWANIKYWVAMHWKTHHWESKVRTQRSDRTGVDRDDLPQDAPVTFVGEMNVQSAIDTMRKRLCCQASPETRAYAEDFKAALLNMREPEISDVLVPNCVYRCGCPEMDGCGYFRQLVETDPDCASQDIQLRYDAYNAQFWSAWGRKSQRRNAMRTERFNELVKEIREASMDTLTKKNANYASSEDRLHNFKVGAAITGGTPAQAALGYMAKHLASLQDKVVRNDFHDREDLKEKVQDSINYLVFIWCCANEEMEGYIAGGTEAAHEG